jgi:branched-chain amino acid transport system ATP-binding protein
MGYTEVSRGPGVVARKDITGMQPHRRARAGLGWVAQEREIFPSLTVEENLTVASRPGRWDLHAVYGLFPRLAERRANMGNQLSGGEQQMLAVARTLMTNPALLLLDEPLEGLAPIIVEELLGVLGNVIRKEGLSAIIVEQKAHKILRFTDRAIILDRGRIVFSGDSAALAADPEVLETHLGVAEQKKGGLSPPLPH